MSKAIGIDIGSKSLKILELEASGDAYRITHFSNLEIPFGSNKNSGLDILVEPIKRIFRDQHLEQTNIAVALPAQDCILREALIDFAHDDHIKKIIKYEAEKYLHSCSVEQVIIEYWKLQMVGENKTKIFLSAVPRELVAGRLAILEQCDLDPLCVDLDIMAIVSLARLSKEITEQNVVVIVDFGATSTRIAVLCKGELRHIRALRLGTNQPEQQRRAKNSALADGEATAEAVDWDVESELIISLPSPEGIDMERMVLLKKEEAPEQRIMMEQKKQDELQERLVREIKRTMLNLDMVNPVDLICLTGGGSQLTGLKEHFEKSLQVKTAFLGIPAKIQCGEYPPEELAAQASVALGMAMRILDKNCKGMNFRKEEFAYTNRFELLKSPLALCATLGMLLIALLAWYFQGQRNKYEQVYGQLLEKTETVCNRIFNGDSLEGKKFNKIYNFLERLKSEQESRQGGGLPEIEDGLSRWHQIFKEFAVVRNHHYIIITKFMLGPTEAVIEGEADSDEALDRLKKTMIKIKDVDPADAKTRIVINEPNPSPRDTPLKRRYRLQIGFRGDQE